MKKIFIPILAIVLTTGISTSCRMAPKDQPGDTVEARYFEPYEPRSTADFDTTAVDSAAVDSAAVDSISL